jgi:hypothetical protein
MRTVGLLRGLLLGALAWGPAVADEPVSFARDVRPILADFCWTCHGPDASSREAELRLDQYAQATAARDGGAAIVPGDSDGSELIRRIVAEEVEVRMPPAESGRVLSADQVAVLRRWIEQGAGYEEHWSLQPVAAPVPPAVSDPGWPRTAVDRFILARLDAVDLPPSPPAPRHTLIRRVYLDLLGLLPPADAVDRLVADARPDWYERLVEGLLASPHFGERWGRYWLDLARYADSHGYTNDDPRIMWPYRDWVLAAVNRDMPFDAFTVEQLAGDLLPQPTPEQLIATGFHRNTLINTEGGVKADQFRDEQVKDRVDTTGVVWLGLTVGCAKCHSHKYDPLDQAEYYRLYAFFNSTADENSIEPTVRGADQETRQAIESLEAQLASLRAPIDTAAQHTSQEQDPAKPQDQSAAQQRLRELERQLAEWERRYPKTMVLRELEAVRPTHVQVRGDFLRPGEAVDADTPAVLPPLRESTAAGRRSDRRDLAEWLVRPDHPLTARVQVNRIWLRLFGRGLVETDDDFGTQGTLPTHPELLDWLAREFQADWSTKRLVRLIVTSAVYQQSSALRDDLRAADPRNQWLARQSRLRVEAEIVRDLALAASGLLTPTVGGPSVHPPQPDGVYAFTQHVREWPTDTGSQRYRRGLYTFFYRSAPHPLLSTFDVPKFNQTCTRRDRSNTPLQSLTMANDAALLELAEGVARRVLCAVPSDADDADRTRLAHLFRLCLVRPADVAELDRLEAYLHSERARWQAAGGAETDVWTSVARVVLNLDEFITRE